MNVLNLQRVSHNNERVTQKLNKWINKKIRNRLHTHSTSCCAHLQSATVTAINASSCSTWCTITSNVIITVFRN